MIGKNFLKYEDCYQDSKYNITFGSGIFCPSRYYYPYYFNYHNWYQPVVFKKFNKISEAEHRREQQRYEQSVEEISKSRGKKRKKKDKPFLDKITVNILQRFHELSDRTAYDNAKDDDRTETTAETSDIRMKEDPNVKGTMDPETKIHRNCPTTTSPTGSCSGIDSNKSKPSFFTKKANTGHQKVTKSISRSMTQDFCLEKRPERRRSETDQISFECETTDHLQKLVDLYNKNRRFTLQSVRLEMIGDGTPVAVGESHVDSRPQAKTNGQVTELKQLQGQVHYYNRYLKSFQLRLVIEPPSEMVVA